MLVKTIFVYVILLMYVVLYPSTKNALLSSKRGKQIFIKDKLYNLTIEIDFTND